MPTRRSLLAAAGALVLTGAARDPFDDLLAGGGDPKAAVPGLAGVAFRDPAGPPTLTVARGLADVATGRPMTEASPVRIASISKLVTAIGFMTLVEAGKVGLDDDVSDILGWSLRHPRFPEAAITPRRLMSHTSGLRNGPSYPVVFGRPLSAALTPGRVQWDDGAWFGPAGEAPGDWFAYADVNYAVIAQLIERLSGQRFDRFMAERVLEPLDLKGGFNWSGVSQAVRDQRAVLYRKAPSDDGPWDAAGPWVAQLDQTLPPALQAAVRVGAEAAGRSLDDYQPGENGFVFAPQGGLRASIIDLDAIGRLLARRGAPILKPETFEAMAAPTWRFDPARPNGEGYGGLIRAYGLGVQTLTGTAGYDDPFDGCAGWIGHAGDAYGLTSGLWVHPNAGRGLAYLLTGQAAPLKRNKGRSMLTRQEEAMAAMLARTPRYP
jgi:CubicO group peptidase (beta-lactamase class C family)